MKSLQTMELFAATLVLIGLQISNVVSAITVTSSKSVENFLSLDLSSNLADYIAHEEFRLRVISSNNATKDEVPLVQNRIKEFKSIQKDIEQNKTSKSRSSLERSCTDNHPTSVLAIMRDFLFVWGTKFANETAYGSRLEEFLKKGNKIPFPTRHDLYRAGAVIAFLQNVYNISKAELVKGNIKGYQGAPLNPADCYHIGKVSFEAKMRDDAIEWLRLSLKSIDLSSNNIWATSTFNVSDALILLSRALYSKDEKEEALKLLERATEIFPEDMALHKLYLAHRFGRKVDLLQPIKTRSSTKTFLEKCSNLTQGLSIANKSHSTGRSCRYKYFSKTPYLRFREEIISNYPFISVIHDFIHQTSIDKILNVAHEKAFRESFLPGGKSGQLWQSKIRTIADFVSPVIKDLSHRISYVTGLGVRQKKGRLSLGEPIHVIDFGPGGTYSPHRDVHKFYHISYIGIPNRSRQATFHLFMNDVKEGGQLLFPELDIGIRPKKGMAVHVHNFKPTGQPESNLLVGICPVLIGRHTVVQKGIFSSGHDQNVLCGKKPLSTHLNVEKARGCIAGPCGAPNTFD